MSTEISRPLQPASHRPSGLHRRYTDDGIPVSRRSLLIPSNINSTVSAPLAPLGPDIEWNPSYKTYTDRVVRLAHLYGSRRPTTVPAGFPRVVDAPWAWSGSDFNDGEEKYVVWLTHDDIEIVERGLAYFKNNRGVKWSPDEVSRNSFPLTETLADRLRVVSVNLHSGYGFNIIRGLDPTRYSAQDNFLIYLGITSYIAEKRGVQDSGGSMIVHVKDLGRILPDAELRQSPYARNSQPFHNDVCDILAMYVQEVAFQGGESQLASSAKIYNEIAASRPDVLHVLAQDSWIFDKHQTPAYWNTRPLLFNFGAKGPGFCFSRRPITGSPTSPRSPGVPPMTELQAEALDMVHFIAIKHQLSLQLQRGDIQLINNLAIQHARSGFQDSPSQKRHIIRLWLRSEELAWPTPPGLQRTWFEKYGNSERRRIATWNFEPGISRERALYRSDSCS